MEQKTERGYYPLELLAPGGSLEGLKAAVNAGADAVYMGGQRFGARAYAQNPDETELLKAIDYCHLHGRKLYLTVNTLLKEGELEGELYDYLLPLYRHGLDAVLVQDFGVFSFLRGNFPDLPLHASTQMNLMGACGAGLLKKMGAERIVLARELTLEEIREIHRQTDIEIECFVHGALCYCYSGQCLMSSLIGGRSGNRGRCAQPCRLPYDLYRDGERMNRPETRYLLSLKDICTLKILPELIEAGVCSFKIEGRMKRAEYASGVTQVYRKYLDRYLEHGSDGYRVDPEDERILLDLYNRGGFSGGYYGQARGRSMMSMERPNHRGTPAARVTEAKGNRLKLLALEPLWEKDTLELEANAGAGAGNTGRELVLKEDVPCGKPFYLELADGKRKQEEAGSRRERIGKGTVLARVRSERLLQTLSDAYGTKELQEPVSGKIVMRSGEPARLTATWSGGTRAEEKPGVTVTVTGEAPLPARNRPLEREILERQLQKTGNTPFFFESLEIDLEGGLFYSMQGINELRRTALEALERKILAGFERNGERKRSTAGGEAERKEGPDVREEQNACGAVLTASVETMEQLEAVLREPELARIYADCCLFLSQPPENGREAFCRAARRLHHAGKQCFLMLPAVWRQETVRIFETVFTEETLAFADGFLLRCNEQLGYFPGAGKEIVADAGIYTYNKKARQSLKELGVSTDTLPLECNRAELRARGCRGSECVVYGYLPLMTTAQCLVWNTAGCRKTPGSCRLKDRRGVSFPVKNFCPVCTNVIYNSVPLDLISCGEELRKLGISSFRLTFTLENAERVRAVTAAAVKGLLRGEYSEKAGLPEEATRGHFKRGVE